MQRTALAVIVALLLAGGGWVAGQTAQVQPYRAPMDLSILSGADIGFRVEEKTPGGSWTLWYPRMGVGRGHGSPRRSSIP